jgi:hypothetical protein
MRKLSIDKENNINCLLDLGDPYTEIAREGGVSKTTISRIKAQYINRPCNESGHPKIMKKRDVAQIVRQVAVGVFESAQKASKIIETA